MGDRKRIHSDTLPCGVRLLIRTTEMWFAKTCLPRVAAFFTYVFIHRIRMWALFVTKTPVYYRIMGSMA